MYDIIEPSPNSTHQLKEHLSRQGESCLESFNNNLFHFASCGMCRSLADSLNLTGTAWYNLGIRHKRRLTTLALQNPQRQKIPGAFESVLSYFNHTELEYINQLAIDAGMSPNNVPFRTIQKLPQDTRERFFSECLDWKRATNPRNNLPGQCLCQICTTTTMEMSDGDPLNNNMTTGASEPKGFKSLARQVHRPTRTQPQQQVACQQVLQPVL